MGDLRVAVNPAYSSGNVQTDPRHLATPHDRTFSSTHKAAAAWRRLRDAARTSAETLVLMQISHPGLQSSSTINMSRAPWVPAVAPCVGRPDMGDSAMGYMLGRMLFPQGSRRLAPDEWGCIVKEFVDVAVRAEEAGFDGVEIHSAHGYLLAEYLSPLVSRLLRDVVSSLSAVDKSSTPSTARRCITCGASPTAPLDDPGWRQTEDEVKLYQSSEDQFVRLRARRSVCCSLSATFIDVLTGRLG